MVSQYDENYDLVFEVYDGVVPATGLNAYTIKLVGRQPGDDPALKYEFTGTVSGIANNIFSFTIDTTMTGRAGKGTAEIVILDTTNDVKFASFNLPVYVEKAAVPDDAIDADVERAQEIAEQVQEIVDTAAAEVKGEAEAWAVGQRDGEDVPSTDPTYENNAKYYAGQAQDIADSIGIDATLSVAGKAADAKKTGDEISELKEDLNALGGGVTTAVRQALLALLQAAVYTETGLSDEITTIQSWAEEITALSASPSTASISGSGTQQLTATTTPTGGTVVWSSSDTSVATVSSGGLVTGVNNGSCTITATCGDKSATCAVTVSGFATLVSIDATYTQTETITTESSLSDLTSDLVVVATYDNSDTVTLTSDQYTLSGQLTLGTSTITVTYGGKSTTFTVTVTSEWDYVWDLTQSLTDTVGGVTAVASAGTGVDAPAITSSGLVFNAATQRLSLGDINLDGKTIEIDVESFVFNGASTAHIRFLMTNSNSGPLIYQKNNRWLAYGLPASGGNTIGWGAFTWSDDSYKTNKNLFNGKTLKLVSDTDNTRTLYLDGVLVATMDSIRYGDDTQDLSIGGTSGYSQSAGDQCYDMVISAIRIKNNPA